MQMQAGTSGMKEDMPNVFMQGAGLIGVELYGLPVVIKHLAAPTAGRA